MRAACGGRRTAYVPLRAAMRRRGTSALGNELSRPPSPIIRRNNDFWESQPAGGSERGRNEAIKKEKALRRGYFFELAMEERGIGIRWT